jgi:hypothetical protein
MLTTTSPEDFLSLVLEERRERKLAYLKNWREDNRIRERVIALMVCTIREELRRMKAFAFECGGLIAIDVHAIASRQHTWNTLELVRFVEHISRHELAHYIQDTLTNSTSESRAEAFANRYSSNSQFVGEVSRFLVDNSRRTRSNSRSEKK